MNPSLSIFTLSFITGIILRQFAEEILPILYLYNSDPKKSGREKSSLIRDMSKCSIKLRLPDILNNLPPEISDKFNTHSIYGLCFYFKRITLPTYESDQ